MNTTNSVNQRLSCYATQWQTTRFRPTSSQTMIPTIVSIPLTIGLDARGFLALLARLVMSS